MPTTVDRPAMFDFPAFRDSSPAWRVGLRSARVNLIPGLVLQVFAVAILVAYYGVPGVAESLERLTEIRLAGGPFYSLVSTALFGAIIPFIYFRMNPATRRTNPWRNLGFLTLWWACQGVVVDYFYQFQEYLWGSGNSITVIVPKVLFDMLVFSALIASPLNTLAYTWKDAGFDSRVFKPFLSGPWFKRVVFPVIISNWAVWTPAVAVLYSMPSALQLPLFNLVLCFWAILLASLTAKGDGAQESAATMTEACKETEASAESL